MLKVEPECPDACKKCTSPLRTSSKSTAGRRPCSTTRTARISEAALLFQALQCFFDVGPRIFLVVFQRFVVGGVADHVANVLASSGTVQVRSKGPFTDAPVLGGALFTRIVVAGHVVGAPIGLPGDGAKVALLCGREVDADVVAAGVLLVVLALAGAGKPGHRHAWLRTGLEGFPVDVHGIVFYTSQTFFLLPPFTGGYPWMRMSNRPVRL